MSVKVIGGVASAISAALAIPSCGVTDKKISQPDIILILADDLGIGDVSCFNPDSKIQTTYLDCLAKDGVMFTDAHATSALSTPSRYSVMTGRFPWRTTIKSGVLNGFSEPMISEDRSTVASMLKEAGYETACIGKWHLGWNWARGENGEIDLSKPICDGPTERGFDRYFGIAASLDMAPFIFVENNMATETATTEMPKDSGVHLVHGGMAGADFKLEDCLPELTRRAVAEIEGWRGSDHPHFLYLPLTAPHTPCLPSEEFRGRTGLGDYGDFVVMMDDCVGKVLQAVKNNGRVQNTIIVFASDNGCAPYAGTKEMEKAGHYPSYIYRGYKNDIFEGGHRIPLIVSGPSSLVGRMRGKHVDELVTLADLYATFANISGGDVPENGAEDSFDMTPLLRGRKDVHHYIVSVSGNGWFSIRDRRYKLIFTPGSGGWGYPSKPSEMKDLPDRQLYDIISDPGETTNLINREDLQEHIAIMTRLLQSCIRDGRSAAGGPASNDTEYLWRQTKPVFGQ